MSDTCTECEGSLRTRDDISVSLVQSVGDDAMICQAARVSTLGTESLGGEESSGLIKFLMNNRHGSPFEHGSMTFLVEAPIFVFREWHRHRAGWSYNETSGRYKELDPVFYVPSSERPLVQEGKPGAYSLVKGSRSQWMSAYNLLNESYEESWDAYQTLLDIGVAKEVARLCLPVGIYSSMYATCNPRSLMHFLSLRTKSAESTFPSYPMHEIADAAGQMERIFADLYPLTYQAWNNNGRVAP
jgi:thymidylate synthase (FAD)